MYRSPNALSQFFAAFWQGEIHIDVSDWFVLQVGESYEELRRRFELEGGIRSSETNLGSSRNWSTF